MLNAAKIKCPKCNEIRIYEMNTPITSFDCKACGYMINRKFNKFLKKIYLKNITITWNKNWTPGNGKARAEILRSFSNEQTDNI